MRVDGVGPRFGHAGDDGAVIALTLRSGRISVTVCGELTHGSSWAGIVIDPRESKSKRCSVFCRLLLLQFPLLYCPSALGSTSSAKTITVLAPPGVERGFLWKLARTNFLSTSPRAAVSGMS